jgi:DNA-directed RNA polymerase subunit RPC12/RpoP
MMTDNSVHFLIVTQEKQGKRNTFTTACGKPWNNGSDKRANVTCPECTGKIYVNPSPAYHRVQL